MELEQILGYKLCSHPNYKREITKCCHFLNFVNGLKFQKTNHLNTGQTSLLFSHYMCPYFRSWGGGVSKIWEFTKKMPNFFLKFSSQSYRDCITYWPIHSCIEFQLYNRLISSLRYIFLERIWSTYSNSLIKLLKTSMYFILILKTMRQMRMDPDTRPECTKAVRHRRGV